MGISNGMRMSVGIRSGAVLRQMEGVQILMGEEA